MPSSARVMLLKDFNKPLPWHKKVWNSVRSFINPAANEFYLAGKDYERMKAVQQHPYGDKPQFDKSQMSKMDEGLKLNLRHHAEMPMMQAVKNDFRGSWIGRTLSGLRRGGAASPAGAFVRRGLADRSCVHNTSIRWLVCAA